MKLAELLTRSRPAATLATQLKRHRHAGASRLEAAKVETKERCRHAQEERAETERKRRAHAKEPAAFLTKAR